MVMTRKIYAAAAALIMAAGTANAQEDLNRSVDVSKDYAPRVQKAAKLGVQPQLGDTVTLRPDLEYTVRPRAWTGGFGVAPIRAAQMNARTYNAQYPIYVKAGGGYPGQTIFDLYATSVGQGAGGFGLYVNHRAQLADLENYYGVKQSAKSTTNSVGVFGKAVFGALKRWSVAGELGVDYDVWSDYGAFYFSTFYDRALKNEDIRMQHYATPRGSIVFGNDFTDFSFLNFRMGADGYSLSDRRDNKETGGRLFVEAGKGFGMSRLIVGAEMDAHEGRTLETGEHGNTIASVSADYRFDYENISFGMGGRFAFEKPSGNDAPDSRAWFLPRMRLKIAFADEFNFNALIISDIKPNSYRNITASNPFWFEYPSLDPQSARISYEARAGFSGILGGVLYYNVYAGGGIVKNEMLLKMLVALYLANDKDADLVKLDNYIYPEKKRQSLFAGAELEANLGNGFAVTAAGRYDKYDSDIYNDEANYLPKYTASLGVSYNHRDKWHLRAGVEIRGEYEFLTYTNQMGYKAPAAANVTLAADYFLSERLGVFLEGENLANQKLYPLPFYRGVGIAVSAGVKLRF